MATSELDTTPVEWKVVRENLVQLHCEDVSWEQATDKIPLDLVRYLLGDLVPHLSTLVFLRGNRCLFTIDWTKIPNSYAVLGVGRGIVCFDKGSDCGISKDVTSL